MRTRPLVDLLPIGVVLAAVVGCGGEATSREPTADATAHSSSGAAATERTSGGAAATQASAGDAAATSDASGAAGAAMCPETTEASLPITDVPGGAGCYVGTNGLWHAVPCLCDLWVDSPRASDLRVSFSLSFTPADLVLSLDGDVNVEVEFPDAGATWFDTWQQQAARDINFTVSHASDEGTTIVRLAKSGVTLQPVPLAACESRHARASIKGPWGTELQLRMVATLADQPGNTVTTINNYCAQPAGHPTPFQGGEAGASSAPP